MTTQDAMAEAVEQARALLQHDHCDAYTKNL